MKKIVFISGIQIFPPQSGGQLRSANFCRSLAQLGHQVEVYSFTGRKIEYKKFRKSCENKIDNNITEYVNRNIFFGIIQHLFYQLSLPPFWLTILTRFYQPKILKNKINQSDSIVLDFPYLYPINKTTEKPIRLNTHNAEFELFQKSPKISRLTKKIELKSFQKMDHIFFCSLHDQQAFLENHKELEFKSSILSNGIDISLFNHKNQKDNEIRENLKINKDQKVFLFTGSYYYPNIDALNFLQNWSTLNSEKLIQLKIVIIVVGTVGQKPIDSSFLKIIGKVDDILPFFRASDYGINPVSLGSGSNVKMVEYIAARLPVLTTPFGARGLSLKDKESCFYFEKENLLSIMEEAISTNPEKIKDMAGLAFERNSRNIDMAKALDSLKIKW